MKWCERIKHIQPRLLLERSLLSKVTSAESVQRPQIRGNSTVGGVRETGGNASDKILTRHGCGRKCFTANF